MKYFYLNLIPETHKKLLKRERKFFLMHNVVGLLVVIIGINSILLLVARFILVGHFNLLKDENALVNSGHNSALQTEIKHINQQIEDTANVQQRFTKWSALLIDIAKVVPPGVTIDFLNVNAASATFRITGMAKNRDLLVAAKETLEALPAVAKLDSPLSNFIEKENITFRFSGTLTKGTYRTLPDAH